MALQVNVKNLWKKNQWNLYCKICYIILHEQYWTASTQVIFVCTFHGYIVCCVYLLTWFLPVLIKLTIYQRRNRFIEKSLMKNT